MKIYLDVLLIFNFLIDYSLLAYTGVIQKEKIRFWRLFVATLTAVLGFFIFMLISYPFVFYTIRIIWTLIIILIAYKYINIKQFIGNVIVYYFLNTVLAGLIISFNLKTININSSNSSSLYLVNSDHVVSWYVIVFSFIIANVMVYFYKLNTEEQAFFDKKIYELKFTLLGITYDCFGFVDTGNQLKVKNHIPVIFISDTIFKEYNQVDFINENIDFTYVNCKGIHKEEMVMAFKPTTFFIKINGQFVEKDVYIAISDNINSKDKHFNAIIQPSVVM